MDNKIICKRVSALLSLYINNKVSNIEKELIETHLNECESCYNKYIYLKSLIKSLKDSYKQIVELSLKKQQQECFVVREHEKFLENLSPYIDNELDTKECYEFRKHLTKSPNAQKELKKAYKLQKELQNSFNKTKTKVSNGISKRVIKSLKITQTQKNEQFLHSFFNIKLTSAAIIISLTIIGAYQIFHIKNNININSSSKAKINYTQTKNNVTQTTKNDFIEF